jgi:hypothetical protein
MDSCLVFEFDQLQNNDGARHADEVNSARPQAGDKSQADDMSNATVMLAAIEAGDSKAAEQLLVLVYELRRLAV